MDYACPPAVVDMSPRYACQTLGLGGKQVEEVYAEDVVSGGELHHIVLGNAHDGTLSGGGEGAGVTGGDAEQTLGLHHVRGFKQLLYGVAMVVGGGADAHLASYKEDQRVARRVGLHHHLAVAINMIGYGKGGEQVADVVAAHAEEEGQRHHLLTDKVYAVFQSCLLLFVNNLAFHRRRVPHSIVAFVVGVNEVGHELGVALQHLLRLLHAHNHE